MYLIKRVKGHFLLILSLSFTKSFFVFEVDCVHNKDNKDEMLSNIISNCVNFKSIRRTKNK